jgi:uncharacterized protein (TIGR01440 family)
MEVKEELQQIGCDVRKAVEELFSLVEVKQGQVFVVGCSTSEVQGERIGSAGSDEVAKVLLTELRHMADRKLVYLAIQCCEHLNRALVVERSAQQKYGWPEVSVIPVHHAGGALAAQAMQDFTDPVVVEEIAAHAGIDIGCTLIGMHLRPVAVPVRLVQKRVGQALIIAAKTRPKLIGGARAVYQ